MEIFPIFHVAIPLAIFEIPYMKQKFEFNRLALIIGTLFPDIIDKSLMLMSLGTGRGISHTLIFTLISFSILFLLTKGNKPISLSFLIGSSFHLLLDLPEIPLFFPLIMYEYTILEDPFGSWFYTLFNDPLVLTTEIVGILILIIILFTNKLFNLKHITNFVIRTHTQEES